jgi:hypothetical protein
VGLACGGLCSQYISMTTISLFAMLGLQSKSNLWAECARDETLLSVVWRIPVPTSVTEKDG